MHRYFVDFYFKARTKEGSLKKYLIEVKPYNQTIEPKRPKRITESYISSVHTYVINQAKWNAAKDFAKKYDMNFLVLTEKELFNK
jgi:ATP-dependent Zn protease